MHLVVFVTASSRAEAETIANGLLQKKLAACVNIIEGVDSKFWWDSRIDSSSEVLLLVKTSQVLFDDLAREVKAVHSYDVPEIIALPIVASEAAYAGWIDQNLKNN